jgi:hypothetical protein
MLFVIPVAFHFLLIYFLIGAAISLPLALLAAMGNIGGKPRPEPPNYDREIQAYMAATGCLPSMHAMWHRHANTAFAASPRVAQHPAPPPRVPVWIVPTLILAIFPCLIALVALIG